MQFDTEETTSLYLYLRKKNPLIPLSSKKGTKTFKKRYFKNLSKAALQSCAVEN